MDVYLRFFLLLLSLCLLVRGLTIHRTLAHAGNENCMWLSPYIFPLQSWNPYEQFIILDMKESLGDFSNYEQGCKIVSLQTFAVTWIERFDNETENNRDAQKKLKVLSNSKVFILKTWLHDVLSDESNHYLKLTLECIGNEVPLTRKCAVLPLTGSSQKRMVQHIPAGRTLLTVPEENEAFTTPKIMLVCAGVVLFGLIVCLFFCVQRACKKAIQNEGYIDEEKPCSGSYHVKVEEEICEEAAQSEPFLNKEERGQSRESGIDEGTQQERDQEKVKLCQDTLEHEYELGTPQSSETPNDSLPVSASNTDSSAGIYEEVTKECVVSTESKVSRNSEPLEVSSLSHNTTDTSAVETEYEKGSAKSKSKKSKKNLKINVSSADSQKSNSDQAQPSSAGAKKNKKWFNKQDENKTVEAKTVKETPVEAESVNRAGERMEGQGGERDRMSTPNLSRQSFPESRPLPPSPISPSVLTDSPPVWPPLSGHDVSGDDYYECVNDRQPVNDDTGGEATYEVFDHHHDSDSDMYTSVEESNRRTSLCGSDTYDSVTATVHTNSDGSVYESVERELNKKEVEVSPPVPSVVKLRKLSVKRESSCDPVKTEAVNSSPTKSNPLVESPVLPVTPEADDCPDETHLYSKPDMEKKRQSKKIKSRQSKEISTDHYTTSEVQIPSTGDEIHPYEPVIPTDVKHLQSEPTNEEHTYDSVSTQDYAEVCKTTSSLDQDSETSPEQGENDVEDPYKVGPEIPYRPPEIDKVFDSDYEECGNIVLNLQRGEIQPANESDSSINITLSDVNTSAGSTNLYEECASLSEQKLPVSDLINAGKVCPDKEDHYEELNVRKDAVESNKL